MTLLWVQHDSVCTKHLTSMSSVLFHYNTATVIISLESFSVLSVSQVCVDVCQLCTSIHFFSYLMFGGGLI